MGKLKREDVLALYEWGVSFLEKNPQIKELHHKLSKKILASQKINANMIQPVSKEEENIKYQVVCIYVAFATTQAVALLTLMLGNFPMMLYWLMFSFFSYYLAVISGRSLQSEEFLAEVEELRARKSGVLRNDVPKFEKKISSLSSEKNGIGNKSDIGLPMEETAEKNNQQSSSKKLLKRLESFLTIGVFLVWLFYASIYPEKIIRLLTDLNVISWLPIDAQPLFQRVFLDSDYLRENSFIIGIIMLIAWGLITGIIKLIFSFFKWFKKFFSVNKNAREI